MASTQWRVWQIVQPSPLGLGFSLPLGRCDVESGITERQIELPHDGWLPAPPLNCWGQGGQIPTSVDQNSSR